MGEKTCKTIKDILLPNADFTIRIIDMEDPEIKEEFHIIRLKQEECINRKIISPDQWEKRITI